MTRERRRPLWFVVAMAMPSFVVTIFRACAASLQQDKTKMEAGNSCRIFIVDILRCSFL